MPRNNTSSATSTTTKPCKSSRLTKKGRACRKSKRDARRQERESSTESGTEESGTTSTTAESTLSNSSNLSSNNSSSASGQDGTSQSYDSQDIDSNYSTTGDDEKFLNQKAKIKWSTAEFICNHYYRKSELFDSKGNVRDEGKITLTVKNGGLRLGYLSNREDFPVLSSSPNSDLTGNHDIVRSVKLSNFTVGIPDDFVLTLNSIPSFQKESFFDLSPAVNKYFLPNEISATKGRRVTLVDRKITNEVMRFQNLFLGINPETFSKHIQPCGGDGKYALVNIDSPLIHVYNNAHKKNQILKAGKGLELTNQVMLTTRKTVKYQGIATESMKKKISYANITNGLSVTISRPLSGKEFKSHKAFIESKGTTGKRHLGLAHPSPTSLSSAKDVKVDDINDPLINIRFKLHTKYRKITDQPIEAKI